MSSYYGVALCSRNMLQSDVVLLRFRRKLFPYDVVLCLRVMLQSCVVALCGTIM